MSKLGRLKKFSLLDYLGLSSRRTPSDHVEIFNWIVVAPDNTVTIRIAQMEMGQGTITSMTQLLAEELEVDWSKIRTEFISIATHLDRDKVYGRTCTESSEGVSRSHLPLRIAGAQIRTMLIEAAAHRLDAQVAELVAENSLVIHKPTGRKLTYGELAADAAKMSVPDPSFIKLKDPKDWNYIGKSLPRIDIPKMINGTAVFGTDIKLPGMKHAAIAMCPVFGGRLKYHEPGMALSKTGVRKVVEIKHKQNGDAIAVIADDWWQASIALDSMPIEWDGGAWATADNASIFSNLQTGLDGPPDKVLRNDGDVNSAMSAAAQTLEAVYHLPYLEHATMEPMNCTALVTDDGFEVWAPTQAPERAIKIAAKAAGMPVSKGNLHVTHMGGGFGRRQNSDFVRQAVKIAKAMKGTPVKLLWSRKETIQHSFFHPTNLSRVRAALDSDGNPIAWSHRLVAPSTNGGVALLGADSLLYAVPNMMVDFVIRRSHVPEGQMRGVGFANNGFVAQCFIDELARAANKDVYAFQHDLLDPNKTPATVPPGKIEGQVIHDVSSGDRAARLRAVLDEAAKRADWHKPLASNSGRGIAVHEQADAYYAVVVEVTLDGTGWFNIDRIIVAGDPSFLLNPKNADAQVEGSVVFGLNSAMYGEITIQEGRVVESNLEDYRILRFPDVPNVEIHWVLSRKSEWGGIGDPVVPPVAPALANAIYDAGGPRIRSLPLKNHKIVKRTSR